MNFRAGGAQPKMRDGWFVDGNSRRVVQPMVFPADHPKPVLRGQAKGMQQVLKERGLFRRGLLMKCPDGCADGATTCCARRIVENQPDFKEQRSLVQEVIEKAGRFFLLCMLLSKVCAGHICIFLPKYHCEINFIEYFWGAVKRYLREHCDYTFSTLKENMPKAMASVSVELIRKWEHRAWRFIDAYKGGLGATEAQRKVKEFSSRKYKSHRRIPERVAAAMDT
jgi:transposase